jgi:hypothetical protein
VDTKNWAKTWNLGYSANHGTGKEITSARKRSTIPEEEEEEKFPYRCVENRRGE